MQGKSGTSVLKMNPYMDPKLCDTPSFVFLACPTFTLSSSSPQSHSTLARSPVKEGAIWAESPLLSEESLS